MFVVAVVVRMIRSRGACSLSMVQRRSFVYPDPWHLYTYRVTLEAVSLDSNQFVYVTYLPTVVTDTNKKRDILLLCHSIRKIKHHTPFIACESLVTTTMT